MKKILLTVLFLLLSLVLFACGSEAEGEEDAQNSEESTEEENKGNTEEQTEDSESPQQGETEETEDGTRTLHRMWEEGETFETGPIVLTIDKIATAEASFEGETADMLETDHIEYIQVDVSVENTSDNDVTFYAGQGRMATSTGEQIEPDLWLSGHIDGEMMAGTKANDTFYYMLENSEAEDVESVRLVFSAPYDSESYDDLGEELDFEIELPKE
ncbi:hypothetical protein [Oceanobacillus sp. FSL W7-1293]|uniref:hypothetical protein n=1 Tax=Oceanobacillus sp. FSL W7-1293 TaxID=2921699 RepID=UPI0030D3EF8F